MQPINAGIIQSFKIKYRKKLVRYVLSLIANDRSASAIANSVDFLQAITWTSDAWKEVTTDTIKNCFAKCGIAEQRVEINDELDHEFEDLFKELPGELESNIIAEEYIYFDAETNTCPPALNSDKIDWRITSIQDSNTLVIWKKETVIMK